jgi:hypothetical protein
LIRNPCQSYFDPNATGQNHCAEVLVAATGPQASIRATQAASDMGHANLRVRGTTHTPAPFEPLGKRLVLPCGADGGIPPISSAQQQLMSNLQG